MAKVEITTLLLLHLLTLVHPDVFGGIKFVGRQEHPAILGDKFYRAQQIINLGLSCEKAQIKSCKAHFQQIVPLK